MFSICGDYDHYSPTTTKQTNRYIQFEINWKIAPNCERKENVERFAEDLYPKRYKTRKGETNLINIWIRIDTYNINK